MSDTNAVSSKRKGRSPSYPGINLETAVQRARQFYEQERQHPTAVGTVAQHWGYKSMNGPAAVTLAALKKFGLVTNEGTGNARRAKVTDLAVDILANPADDVRSSAVKEAALSPLIHSELWKKYGASLPSDSSLRWELTRDRGFTETGADEFIPEYHDTVAFAQLAEHGGTLPLKRDGLERHGDGDGSGEHHEETARRPLDRGTKQEGQRTRMSDSETVYAIPLPRGAGTVQVGANFPLSESEWQYFIALLNAMKDGLVDDGGQDDD